MSQKVNWIRKMLDCLFWLFNVGSMLFRVDFIRKEEAPVKRVWEKEIRREKCNFPSRFRFVSKVITPWEFATDSVFQSKQRANMYPDSG